MTKRKNRIVRQRSCFIIKYACIQLLIITFCIYSANLNALVNTEKTMQIVVSVDKVEYITRSKGSNLFFVYSGNKKFFFIEVANDNNYSNRELQKAISVGEQIHLTYCERFSIWGSNIVVAAHTKDAQLRTIEGFNENGGVMPTLLGGFILELILVCCIYLDLAGKEHLFKRKTKRKTGDG